MALTIGEVRRLNRRFAFTVQLDDEASRLKSCATARTSLIAESRR
jgi:hypothetical protein